MERLGIVSKSLGEKLVKNEGSREVSLRKALGLWSQHLFLKAYGVHELKSGASGYSIGMGESKPVLFGEENKSNPSE